MTSQRTPEKMRVAAVLRQAMELRGVRRVDLARALDITPTMVGFWLRGQYLPSMDRAEAMAAILDAPAILFLTHQASIGTCRVCLAPFRRIRNDARTRRSFCSMDCFRAFHKGVSAKVRPPAEAAIAAFCRGCEPEGLCRTEDCALRAFSPLMFKARRVA